MPGRGCGIHLDRPFVCRGAYCHWMLTPGLGPEWKPEVAKFAIFVRNGGTRITAHVDAGHPGAWRREPYYKTFKAWAAKAIAQRPQMHMVDVMIGERTTVILPGRDVEVGIIAADEAVQPRPSYDRNGRNRRCARHQARDGRSAQRLSHAPIRATASRISAAGPA